jgi:hypothetical protein
MRTFLYFLLASFSLISADTIQRDRTALRQGPGAWYPMLAELSSGSEVQILSRGVSWIEITYEDNTGYISENALKGKAKEVDVFAQMAMIEPPKAVSQSAVTASIKGFADKMSKRLDADPKNFDKLLSERIQAAEYKKFKDKGIKERDLNMLRRVYSLPYQKRNVSFTFSEEGVGYAVAAKLMSLGLVEDPLNSYVNLVGTFVAEQSHGYDIQFKFFILDQPGINGYACPGGIIFITKGALDAMENEAELACFLGHEIAHVSARHGLKEMEERKEMIFADNAFDEMSTTVGESAEIKQVSQDLDDMALDSYERIFSGRLADYEEEADEWGLIYAARSGYDPKAMIAYLKRMESKNLSSNNEHYSHSENRLRIDRLNKLLSANRWSNKKFVKKSERFDLFVQ